MGIGTKLSAVRQALRPVSLLPWVRRMGDAGGIRGFLARQAATAVMTIRSLGGAELTLRAAALTYRTLLALVPTMAVAFALFGAFGGLDRLKAPLKDVLLENLAVGRSAEVGAWLDQFITNVNAGAIAGVGVLGLAYTAVGLLTDIEASVNRVWGVRSERPFLLRFGLYWALLTLAPPLLAYSVSLSAQLESSEFAAAVVEWLPLGLGPLLLSLTTVIAVCLVLAITYLAVPNTRVAPGSAVAGGIVAGILWSILKSIFISFVATSVQYNAVYGALGALPLLMLWLYFSWIVVLFGARFAYVHQSMTLEGFLDPGGEPGSLARERLALLLAVEASRDHVAGAPPPTLRVLAKRISVMPRLAARLLDTLVEAGVLVRTAAADPGYVPGRDLRALTLEDVAGAFRDRPQVPRESDPVRLAADQVAAEADAAARRVLAGVRLSDLVAPPERSDGSRRDPQT